MAIRASRLSRRTFLVRGCASVATLAAGLAAPRISRAADRPVITHGVQSGDVSHDGAIVWSRADRPARMIVDIASTDRFRDIHQTLFADALPESDFTAKLLVDDLPAGQDMFYRVRFQDLAFPALSGDAQIGHFRTPRRVGDLGSGVARQHIRTACAFPERLRAGAGRESCAMLWAAVLRPRGYRRRKRRHDGVAEGRR